MNAIIPYIMLNGRAEEAMNFYAKALNGSVLNKSTYGESGQPTSDSMKDKIMHAAIQSGNMMIMFSDCPPEQASVNGSSVQLSINFTDEATINKTFEILAEGASITMPLQDTFWGARFGMLTDKFGIHWMFNYDKEPKEN